MSLEFSYLPVCVPRLSEDRLVSPIEIASRKTGNCGSQECDILDILPEDPFGWIEDMEVNYGGYGIDEAELGYDEYQLNDGLHFFCLNAMTLQAFSADVMNIDKFCGMGDSVGCTEETDLVSDIAAPNAAISFALGYLGVRDLMVAGSVCKSLRSIVYYDPLLWRNIHIDHPLNNKITDAILLELSNRAQGSMQSLSLVECPKITDDCLKQILDCNPRLTKLSISGCTRIGIDAIVTNLKHFKSTGKQGINYLRVGAIYGVTHQHLKELMQLLDASRQIHPHAPMPRYFHMKHLYPSSDDDRTIDLEVCPRCKNVRLVYDCPAEGCQRTEHGDQECRACTLCISRCAQCGQCISECEYDETFCLQLVCLKCKERLNNEGWSIEM